MAHQSASEIELFVQRHQGSVRGFLIYLGCAGDRLDDLMQDVFLSFLSANFEDRGELATRAFLRRIARNLFLKGIERERRQIVQSDSALAEVAWANFESGDGGNRYLVALRECLSGLRGRALEVLRLRYEESVQLVGVATRLGLSESGVKSILVRSKRKLRECVERRLGI
jgi:RNA polymerase sigma-70 factor (ECF subfamily)